MTATHCGSALMFVYKSAMRVVLVIATILAVGSWLDPNHHEPWHAFHGQLWATLATCLVAVWVLAEAVRRGSSAWVPWPALGFLALALYPWLQWLVGIVYFAGDAWMASLYLAGSGLAIALGHNWTRRSGLGQVVTAISGVLVAAGLLSMWLSLCQLWEIDYFGYFAVPTRPDGRVSANLSQPNHLAILMVMAIAAAVSLRVRSHISGVTLLSLASVFSMTLVLTGSRAGAVALAATLTWMTLTNSSRTHKQGAGLFVLVGVACLVGIGAAMLQSGLVTQMNADAVTTRSVESLTEAGPRPIHWRSMFDAATRRPWTGYGWAQIFVAQYEVAPDHPPTRELISSSHNILLDLMVAMGAIPGLAVGVLLAGWVCYLAWQARSREAWMAVSLIIPVAVYSLLEFPQEYAYFLLSACVLLGGVHAETPGTARLTVRTPLAFTVAVIGGFFAALAITVNDYWVVEQTSRNIRFEQVRLGRLGPQPREPVLVLTQVQAFFRYVDTPDADGMSPEQLLGFEQVAKRYPNWTALSRWAAALARNGDPEQAANVLSRICKTHSTSNCMQARKQWEIRSASIPALAKVSWPDPSPQ